MRGERGDRDSLQLVQSAVLSRGAVIGVEVTRSVQLANSKPHMQSLRSQEPSNGIATEALAELSTSLAEVEANQRRATTE